MGAVTPDFPCRPRFRNDRDSQPVGDPLRLIPLSKLWRIG